MAVTFCIDRAGISGADGETHQGVFDLSYLSLIPNLTIAVPKDTEELKKLLEFSATYTHPLAIRYPRAGKILFDVADNEDIQVGKWEYLHRVNKEENAKLTVIAAGERCLIIAMKVLQNLQKKGFDFDIINARFAKPLDVEFLKNLKSSHLITLEDNVFLGGLGSMIDGELIKQEKMLRVKNFAYRDEFITQGSVAALQSEYGVDCHEIEEYIQTIL